MTRLVIDASIAGATVGADPAEGLGLLLALLDPDVRLEGIILTGGDLHIKAAQVRKLFEVAGRSVPLALGATHDLLGRASRDASLRPPTANFVSGHRSIGGLPNALELLQEVTAQGEGTVSLMVLGRATTTALALLAAPRLILGLNRVYLCGCSVGFPLREQQDGADAHAVATVIRLAGDRVILHDPGPPPGVSIPRRQFECSRESDTSSLFEFVSEYSESWLTYYERSELPLAAALPVIGAAHPSIRTIQRRRYALDPCCRSYSEMILPAQEGVGAPRVSPPGLLVSLDTMTDYDPEGCIGFVESVLDFPPLPPPEDEPASTLPSPQPPIR